MRNEGAGLVFVTSDEAQIAIIEKSVQQTRQVDLCEDEWPDKEHPVKDCTITGLLSHDKISICRQLTSAKITWS